MKDHRTLAQGILFATVLVLAGCATGEVDTDTATAADEAAAPRIVTVSASDYAFEAPDSIPAGMTTFRLLNAGPELHHVQLVRLDSGRTMKDLMEGLKHAHTGPLPGWMVAVGGPNAPAPQAAADATLDLAPGNYAIICMIPSPDGTPHLMKGMVRALTVTPATGASAAAPKADMTMKLVDYAFDMPATITPGRHVIRVENVAEQPHEVVIAQLAPGKKAHELLAWLEKMQGPPPGKPLGGASFMVKDAVNYISVDLEPGTYALYCFVPDAKDGKPHVAHGMMREFTVGS